MPATDQSAEPAQTEPAIAEAAHTPGPWSIVPQNGVGPMIAREYETGKQMNPKGLRLVCHVLARGNSLPEDEANARLIAAAPDLLAALTEVMDWVKHWDPNFAQDAEWPATAAKVDAALSRAAGEGE